MKAGMSEIVGKEIVGVVAAKNDDMPNRQVFLVFSDGTYFEFWGDSFSCASGVNHGDVEEVLKSAVKMGGTITHTYRRGCM